ncbi:signal transduction histidine kinase [Dyadobacter sp. BE34]|uniref:histidine kinase n=1 Tax=Dyadobacter fermentans TaxID=94254 RepID=A0ABU1QXA2_9BACT|nr:MULTISPECIES: GAF domain-containing sensor histidine kinase [Dyadobacter]MDR6805781.1 signal transduction histidine kinase [Dyadobacter fermentans]MDR7042458.1 signal transduction histidine kinase [Dyadobacter sp. BE242]MDR7196771.1 signal transduction histidine kinase [Dyadobacter sp. BE34]MDR7215795.1 signal transduction histidine kinase [Dyadobacter sp. BE31]MDR7263331.1 signal transduction histidine kinase [Dyadobacter sp. BE32]
MSTPNAPVPANEMERLLALSELDIDYSDHQITFQDLAKLAAKVTGTRISLVNLLDSLTQWTISNYGFDIEQMLREDSVCQYTIMESDHFEVGDLSADERFKDKIYVTSEPNVKYYYGIPLKTSEGLQIGALCVLDQERKTLEPEKIELLKIIADEIVARLKTHKVLENLKSRLLEAGQTQKKVAHDIRGPLGGIVGLAQIIRDQGEHNRMDEVLEFINLIHKSGNSILDLAEEILDSHREKATGANVPPASNGQGFTLMIFKDKLEKLYGPQGKHKNIRFRVETSPLTENIHFSKSKLLQITGNLISNSMKFTPPGGEVAVDLHLLIDQARPVLQISVRDTGVGISEENIRAILSGSASSTDGTGGEQGFGFGLALVKHLVDSLGGRINITSEPGVGTNFEINLPQNIY